MYVPIVSHSGSGTGIGVSGSTGAAVGDGPSGTVGRITLSTTWITPLQAEMSVVIISGIASRELPAPFWKVESPTHNVRVSLPLSILTSSRQFKSELVTTVPEIVWYVSTNVNASAKDEE